VLIDRVTRRLVQFGKRPGTTCCRCSRRIARRSTSCRSPGAHRISGQPLAYSGPAGAPRRVLDQPGIKTHPDVSPDGRWLTYYRNEDGRRDVWIAPLFGGEPVRITDDGASTDPSWSPDGATLAFISERDGSSQIWTQSVTKRHTGGPQLKVSSGSGPFLSGPAWFARRPAHRLHHGRRDGASEAGLVSVKGGRPMAVTSGAGALCVRWLARTGLLLVGRLVGDGAVRSPVGASDGRVARDAGPPIVLGPRRVRRVLRRVARWPFHRVGPHEEQRARLGAGGEGSVVLGSRPLIGGGKRRSTR